MVPALPNVVLTEAK
ncbi:MAG: hypothetical protein EZS28_032414, partial [Streblomastix strix]